YIDKWSRRHWAITNRRLYTIATPDGESMKKEHTRYVPFGVSNTTDKRARKERMIIINETNFFG
ncbi:MAG: hypothetical protein K0S04_221, partial [Herbinix sp.]|nr:hypothetical protein [Herbinix sp.]